MIKMFLAAMLLTVSANGLANQIQFTTSPFYGDCEEGCVGRVRGTITIHYPFSYPNGASGDWGYSVWFAGAEDQERMNEWHFLWLRPGEIDLSDSDVEISSTLPSGALASLITQAGDWSIDVSDSGTWYGMPPHTSIAWRGSGFVLQAPMETLFSLPEPGSAALAVLVLALAKQRANRLKKRPLH